MLKISENDHHPKNAEESKKISLQLVELKDVVQDFNGFLGVILVHDERDVRLRRALADHPDVDALAAQRGEQLTGNARGAGHALAYDGDDAHVIITGDVAHELLAELLTQRDERLIDLGAVDSQ